MDETLHLVLKRRAVREKCVAIADALEQVHPNDLPGPEGHRHWVRFALNRQAAAVREAWKP